MMIMIIMITMKLIMILLIIITLLRSYEPIVVLVVAGEQTINKYE